MNEQSRFLPEGLSHISDEYLGSIQGLTRAMNSDKILEATAILCDLKHNLYVDLGNGLRGKIPHDECAIGIREGVTREIAIISRVGKPVCFKVESVGDEIILSRRKAQEEALDYLLSFKVIGDIIPVKVTHLEQFGAFVDIGCGIVSLIGIENISVSRIFHPSERFHVGMDARAIISGIDFPNRRILLSHKELLGTWEENAKNFTAGETIIGTVRSVENYGIFVELTPNLSGLAEIHPDIKAGMRVSVYVKSIVPEKMKIKLSIIGVFESVPPSHEINYYISENHLGSWVYAPENSIGKKIHTFFD